MKSGSNTIVWILGGALVLALMVIAFLLGRGAQPTTETLGGPVAIIDRSTGAEPAAAPPPPAAPAEAPEPTTRAAAGKPNEVVITNAGGGEPRIERGAPAPSRPGSSATAITDYFAAVDKIQAGPQAMSPDAFAQGLATDISSGDASGLQRLEADLTKAERELNGVTPPSECAHYHEELLTTLRDSRDMLRTMTNAITSGDTSSLATLAGQAGQLQQRQRKLEKMRKDIERR